MPRRGPTAKVDPGKLVDFLDTHTAYVTGGHPVRRRKSINGVAVIENDNRMIRRWRKGDITGVTESSARALLRRYNINPREFTV